MAKRTKKVGTSGRLGARYGVRIRKRIADIEWQGRGKHECPECRANSVKRRAGGIWSCAHCGATFASSSYMPTAPAAIRREVAEELERVEKAEEELERPEDEGEEREV